MQIRRERFLPRTLLYAAFALFLSFPVVGAAKVQEARAEAAVIPAPEILSSGWELQDSAKLPQTGSGAGAIISALTYKPKDWYSAVVPGTVLTTLVKNGVYPEPLYGENNRPDRIPESLNKTTWWYRTVFDQRGEHCAGDDGGVPVFGLVGKRGDDCA